MSGVIIFIMCSAVVIVVFIIKRITALNSCCRRCGFIIVPYNSKTENLSKTVKSYYWEEVFEAESMGREILLVKMDNSDNDYTAKRLSEEYSIVSVLHISELEEYLRNAYN
ncbi:MAG: hypothetical protein IJU04_05215 [Ruminococcus sp.]|nr:hypothetical protein [Ruminococcus sp.]